MRCAVVVGLSALLAVSPAADVLVLEDGRVFDGIDVDRGEEAFVVHYRNGDVTVPMGLVRDAVIEGEEFVPTTAEERKNLEKGYVRYEGKWVKKAARDRAVAKVLEEKRAQVEEAKLVSEWKNGIREETANFVFTATVPRHVFERYRDLMEAYYQDFCKTWKIRRSKDIAKLTVGFHADYNKYLQVSGAPPGTGGYFYVIAPYDLNMYYDRLDPRSTEGVMYHEAGHYLHKLIEPDFRYPHFPGESLAEYYGSSTWDSAKRKFITGEVNETRLAEIQFDILNGKKIGLRELIYTGAPDMYEHYTWGWSLVHFLMNDKRYRKGFHKFYLGLALDKKVKRTLGRIGWEVSGEEMWRLFCKELKLKKESDIDGLEAEWHDYVEHELEVTSARGLASAARRAAMQGRDVRAKRLYEEALAAGDASAHTYHSFAKLIADKDYDRAVACWKSAIEADPLTADFYVDLGRKMVKKKEDREEGERLLKLAFEIDPENKWLDRNLNRILGD